MTSYCAPVAAFAILGVVLFGTALFMIGDRHKAFSHHLDFYADLANVDGLNPGAHVRVNGYDAGEVRSVAIPDRPEGKFRLQLRVDDKLKGLLRADSFVTVESDGLVGDKFILIHNGTEKASTIGDGATLTSKEPLELSAILQKVNGTVEDASTTLVDVRGRLDTALDAVTNTVNNTNGIVTGIRHGHGPIGALLTDQQMTNDLKATVANTRSATTNLDDLSLRAGQVMTDFQSRNLAAKVDQTLDNVRSASSQINQATVTLNTNLTQALGPDRHGHTASENLQQTLANVNGATSNMADDTEALKHEFFFRGFFKKRGFYALSDLTPDEYRASQFFSAATRSRFWLQPDTAFTTDGTGQEALSADGNRQIDAFMEQSGGGQSNSPILIEGYSALSSPLDQIVQSKQRALTVKLYIEKRLTLDPKNIGVIALSATPPPAAGKSTWDGVSIVLLKRRSEAGVPSHSPARHFLEELHLSKRDGIQVRHPGTPARRRGYLE